MSTVGLVGGPALIGCGLSAAVMVGVGTAVAALAVSGRVRPAVVGAGTALTGAAALLAGVTALAGVPFAVRLPGLLPLAGLTFVLDPLGGFFIVVTGAVSVITGIYAGSYTRAPAPRARAGQAALPLFVVAMTLVPAAASVATLLFCWELMAVSSLPLVVVEHRHRPAVASAGRWYAVLTQLGFVALLCGLLGFAAYAADDSFTALRTAAATLPAGAWAAVFGATLVGFASKAGIVPMHPWLPRAHPEAPSHISALMSAAMVNLGVYGIVRVGFDLLGFRVSGEARWAWLVVLGLGACSAVYGILQAAMSTDLKRLLGQSTVENMGLVLVGVGAAGWLASGGNQKLAAVAMAAALLHTLNHAAFKTLLFLAAGSVLRGAGTRDLDALGGLRTGMPITTGLFGVGALAASALPPGTAFVSEWLLLQALIHGLPSSPATLPTTAGATTAAIAMPVAVAAVALTAGLSVATFVKAFGVGFLAKPRSSGAERARESPIGMLAGMTLASTACVLLALLPGSVLPAIDAAGAVALGPEGSNSPFAPGRLVLPAMPGSLSPLLLAAALVAAVLAVLGGVRMATRRMARRRGAVHVGRQGGAARGDRRVARTWDCGGGPLSARMEYTATSFAEPLQRVFDTVVRPEQQVAVTHDQRSQYLVRQVRFRRRVPDRVERWLYAPVLAAVDAWGRVGRGLATGSVHRYLGYGFYTVCGLLIMLAVLR